MWATKQVVMHNYQKLNSIPVGYQMIKKYAYKKPKRILLLGFYIIKFIIHHYCFAGDTISFSLKLLLFLIQNIEQHQRRPKIILQ